MDQMSKARIDSTMPQSHMLVLTYLCSYANAGYYATTFTMLHWTITDIILDTSDMPNA